MKFVNIAILIIGLIILASLSGLLSITVPSSNSNIICSHESGHDLSCNIKYASRTISFDDSKSFAFNPYENLVPVASVARIDGLPLTCEESSYTCDRQLLANYYITKYYNSTIVAYTNYGTYNGICDFAISKCTFKTDFSKIPRNADGSYPTLAINSMKLTLRNTQAQPNVPASEPVTNTQATTQTSTEDTQSTTYNCTTNNEGCESWLSRIIRAIKEFFTR